MEHLVEHLIDTEAAVKPGADEICCLLLAGGGERRTGPFTGPKALMFAVLQDGIRSYFSRKVRVREEADRWVSDTRARSVFSFTVICETLGLEPSALCKGLRRLRARGATPGVIGRSRPGVYARGGLGRHHIGGRPGRSIGNTCDRPRSRAA